jgi:death-on-curing protein
VELIHDELVSAVWPDIDPVSAGEYRNKQLLESALGRPFQSAGGQDAYPTIIEKAAALFHSLIANHPFHNGNKRTAVLSMDAFLMGNGYTMAVDNDRMYELAQDTASYRERGVSHNDQLAKITETLDEHSVEIGVLRSVKVSDPEMRRKLTSYCKTQLTIGRSVRRHSANTLIAPESP